MPKKGRTEEEILRVLREAQAGETVERRAAGIPAEIPARSHGARLPQGA